MDRRPACSLLPPTVDSGARDALHRVAVGETFWPKMMKGVLLGRITIFRCRWFALAIAVILAPFASAPARAHAILIRSTPAIGGAAAGPMIAFDLRYNSRIDHERSILTLTEPDSAKQILPIDPESAVNQLRAAAPLKPGAYILRWQVLATDGHITRGDIPFTVTRP
jgi:methionine-rich copper-binding protein CopC